MANECSNFICGMRLLTVNFSRMLGQSLSELGVGTYGLGWVVVMHNPNLSLWAGSVS